MNSDPRRHSLKSVALWSAGVGLLVVLLGILVFAVFTAQLTVDGRRVRVRADTTVGDLERRGLVGGHAGNLVSAGSRRVLSLGGGDPRQTLVDGVVAAADQRIRNGETIVGRNGGDVVEPVKRRTEAIPLTVKYEGAGPVETIVTTGSPGTLGIRYGSKSGQVVSRRVEKEPVARLVVRSQPAAGAKLIALTFDDGPWPGQTEAVLKILQRNHVPATFFEIGQQARAHPGISRTLTDAGMLIGNHTETHPLNLGRLSSSRVASEIDRAETDISAASGQRPKYFRPPGGNTTSAMYPVLSKLELQWVQWDIDTEDWKQPPSSAIVGKVLAQARPGAVVLMHDGGGNRAHTIAALPTIIAKLRAQGYVFVTLDGLRTLPHRMG